MIGIYSSIMGASTFFLKSLLNKRLKKGKEDPERIKERMGEASLARPDTALAWFHAASVGESQSTLILIDAFLKKYPEITILVTTGTMTSAELMAKRLPRGAIHQYYPLDHPKWVELFLDHWKPDVAIWVESEIWPNMLKGIEKRNIPVAIVNARLSPESFKRWKLAAKDIKKILNIFSVCLTQTEDDAKFFKELGAENVKVTGNLKYSAAPLPVEDDDLQKLANATKNRESWLYASTHEGEEEMACRIHRHIEKSIPGLLTMIAPRHPERRDSIVKACEKYGLNIKLRSQNKNLPDDNTQIYIIDTMGELGLFYRYSPIACIGRSFSNDGGGGHNPIEAGQLGCAVLHGPNVQNLKQIFDEFDQTGAALNLKNEQDFQNRLERMLKDHDGLEAMQNKAGRFVEDKAKVLQKVLSALDPVTSCLNDTDSKKRCA